ncbi:peptide-methionine (S)-S-oxide reductase MsrA [Methanolobus sediminis]|uniref:Peptide methionine sulfoxide reductase MsrA n=1 Tax=Methanolobus sediminis TaxID=3072978 RepID=A0AA51UML2_9EURY|nr:peptide-methionine (S)-S-oxide reductase MsrA [Methanolobus sediminis]WMW24770.1 peptide-methionine (S)-S-oxide reductase MsrA [Methanolobus sediminis]
MLSKGELPGDGTLSQENLLRDGVLLKEELLSKGYEKATFAAGCFWGVEAVFRKVQGVDFTQVGYTGGNKENPTYKEVCMGNTGHAEAVELLFDPSIVSYDKLLELFWELHDPTSLNKQGPDVGTQYRSAIFYHNEEQKNKAMSSKKELELSHRFKKPIVTQIMPAGPFYRAEEYHQQYFEKTGTEGGCILKY